MSAISTALSRRAVRAAVLVLATCGFLIAGWWVMRADAGHAPASTVHACAGGNGTLRLAEACRPREDPLVLATESGLQEARARIPQVWSVEPRDGTSTLSASALGTQLHRVQAEIPGPGVVVVSGSVGIDNTSSQEVDVRLQTLLSDQRYRLAPGEVTGAAITGSFEVTEEIFQELEKDFDGELTVSLRATIEPTTVDASEHVEFSSAHLNVRFFKASQATFVGE